MGTLRRRINIILLLIRFNWEHIHVSDPFTKRPLPVCDLRELIQGLGKKLKKQRAKFKERRYVDLKDCVNIPQEEQKNLLVFASVYWRQLIRPDEPSEHR